MSKLPILQITKSSYEFIFSHQTVFWQLAKLPMAVFCAISFLLYLFFYLFLSEVFSEAFVKTGLILLLGIVSLPFFVAWHRLVLLGPEAVSGHRGLVYGRREGMFILWGIIIGCLFSAPVLFVYLLPVPKAMSLVVVLIMLPILRLYLVFPLVATDPSTSVRAVASVNAVWALTKGNTIRIVFALLCIALPIQILGWLVSLTGFYMGPVILGVYGYGVLGVVIDMMVRFAAAAVIASFLSLTYLFLTSSGDDAEKLLSHDI